MKISVLTPSIRPEGLAITREGLMQQTFQDFEWLTEIGIGRHDLNAAYNRMLRRAKGELIVSLQDYIKITPEYLQKFWDAYQAHPNAFITAPVGKSKQQDFGGEVAWDWRAWNRPGEEMKAIMPSKWDTWEIDSGAAPLAALKAIGGFDEVMDGHWSCDNLNVGCRAELAGHEFLNLFENPSIAYDHDAFMPHPFRADYDPTFNAKRMVMFRGGMTLPPIE